MAVPTSFVFFVQNDQYFEWGPLIDGTTEGSATPTYWNNLTGTVTLKDPQGVNVPNFTAIALSYVAASNGTYRALIEQTFNPPIGSGYLLVIDMSAPGSEPRADAHWEIPASVKTRRTS